MSVLIFVLLRVMPGNISDILFESAGLVNPAEKAKIEKELGLDQPLVVQYSLWINGLVRGDLGYAYVSEKPALDEILPRIPVTAKLAFLALFFSIVLGVPLGVISAVRQDTALDYVLRVISLSGLSLPSFWLGLLILMGFVQYLGWIPIYTDKPSSVWHELGLLSIPAAAVGFRASALIMRLTRSSMLEVLGSEYIKLARLKGLPESRVIAKHAFKNALIPVLTLAGINLVIMINVAVVVETVFAWPGVGRLLYEGITFRDFPVVQAVVLLGGAMIVVVNLLIDVLYAVIDPRIRLEA